jgi:hypothetical protein
MVPPSGRCCAGRLDTRYCFAQGGQGQEETSRILRVGVCVGYLGGKLDWIPRCHARRGNEESSSRKRRTPRSSCRAAGGCGATGGPRCHGWQRGPATQPLVVQGLIGPRKARCHVATHFKAGNEGQTDQDRQRQSNALAQAASQSAARARRGRAPSFPRSAGERGAYPRKDAHPISAGGGQLGG